jgi:hypothetical protein
MLQISESQMQGFQNASLESFVQRGLTHFRKRLPDDAARYSDEELKARIRRAIGRCKLYGLTTEQQIMSFADTGLLIGENFDTDPEHPWAQHILRKENVAPEDKASVVLHIALSIRREEAGRHRMLPRGRRSIYVCDEPDTGERA